jgi:hypothetical protein
MKMKTEENRRAKLYSPGGSRIHLADELFDEETLCGIVGYALESDREPERFKDWPMCSHCRRAEKKLTQ